MNKVFIKRILGILNNHLENVDITLNKLDEDLVQLGMDSITFMRIIVLFEEEFDCEIPDSKLLMTEMNTVNKMLTVLQSIKSEKEE